MKKNLLGKITHVFITLIVITGLLVMARPLPVSGNPSWLKVSFIDVGKGDSILVSASDGTDILIDGGKAIAGPTVVAYLQAEGIDDIDYLVLSHPHVDHIGGLIDVLESDIPVETIIEGVPGSIDMYSDFLTAANNAGLTPVQVVAGQTYDWGDIQVKVLNPQNPPKNDPNPDSVVLLMTYDDHKFLFTGDIVFSAEMTLLQSGVDLDADVLKVPHHGINDASSTWFLNAVSPNIAVITNGIETNYPVSQKVLQRLESVGADIYRTDLDGTVVITVNGNTLSSSQPDTSDVTMSSFGAASSGMSVLGGIIALTSGAALWIRRRLQSTEPEED